MNAPVEPVAERRVSQVLLPLVILAAALALGYVIKARCTTHAWDGFQYRSSCYNDLYSLASFRGINDGAVPYLDGDGVADADGDHVDEPDGDLEYPVGTGYVVMLAGAIASDGVEFFNITVVLLALCGLVAGLQLIAMARDRWRLMLMFASPPLVLYAFHNWDLLAVMIVVLAIASWRAGKPIGTAIWLGIGAATKVYPGVLLPAFLLAEGRRTRTVPWKMIGASAAAFVIVNLPILLANAKAWLFPWTFQGTRFPNFETHWYSILRHVGQGGDFWNEGYPRLTSVLSGLLFVAGLVVLVRRENRRAEVRPIVLAFAILVWWLLTAKVYSPQFSLWLLPFFVLITVPVRAWVAFVVADAAVWAAVSFFFLADQGSTDAELRLWLVEAVTFARYGALIWLLRSTRDASERISDAGDHEHLVPERRAQLLPG